MPTYDVKTNPEKWARFREFTKNQIVELVRAAMGQRPSGADDFKRMGSTDWNAAQDREAMDRSRIALLRFLAGECE